MILNEGYSDILYHFTSFRNGLNICKEDRIYFQSALSKDSDNYDKKRKFYLSTTRIRGSQFGYSRKFSKYGGVRIVLDGRKLKNKYKGTQVNYWKGMVDKYNHMSHVGKGNHISDYEINNFWKEHPDATQDEFEHWKDMHFNEEAQTHYGNESEDRIFSYDPVMDNAHEYILYVDVLIDKVLENERKLSMAQEFLYGDGRRYQNRIRIYDSVEQFDGMGKTVNEQIPYSDVFTRPRDTFGDASYQLEKSVSAVVGFISYGDHEYDGKRFGPAVSRLLKKYGLGEFTYLIPKIRGYLDTITSVSEKLDSIRRDLSDRPSDKNSKLLRMLTDYFRSIGATSFREGIRKKNELVDEYYMSRRSMDDVDTQTPKLVAVVNNSVVSLYPDKDRFIDTLSERWIENLRYTADAIAYEVLDNNEEGKYHSYGSKNETSLFQYIYKMFRKGSVLDVYRMYRNLGVIDYVNEYRNAFVSVDLKELNYWDACNYYTIYAVKHPNESWKKLNYMNEKELFNFFRRK